MRKRGNKYNRVDTGNNFGNNTYKLVFKGIKSQNQKHTINIPYHWNYKQLMVAVESFRKTLKAEPNASLWYIIRKGVESVLFNDKDLDIFKTKMKEGLSKANTLWSIIGLKE